MDTAIKTRFLILSDTHDVELSNNINSAFRHPLPTADVVLHCGDLTRNGGLESYTKAIRMLGNINAELKLVIAGNHEVSLDKDFYTQQGGDVDEWEESLKLWRSPFAEEMGVTYLEEGTHHFSLKNGATFTVYASPYTPRNGVSAFQYPTNEDRFNPPQGAAAATVNVANQRTIIPEFPKIDIVMTHGPPRFILDACGNGNNGGCEYLREAICRAKPRLHCFGHMHGAWGARTVIWKGSGEIEEANMYDGQKGNGYDDMIPLPQEFVGKTWCRKRGYASLRNWTGCRTAHGKRTLLVNAAIMDNAGEPTTAPWLVDLDLARSIV